MRSVRFEARPQGKLKQCRPDFPALHGSWPATSTASQVTLSRRRDGFRAGTCRARRRPVAGAAGPRETSFRWRSASPASTLGRLDQGMPRHAATVRSFTPVAGLGYVTFGAVAHRPTMGAARSGFPSGVLVGVLLIAGTREIPRGGSRPETGSPGSWRPGCVQGVPDARRAAEVARPAAGAAADEGRAATGLTESLPTARSRCSTDLSVES